MKSASAAFYKCFKSGLVSRDGGSPRAACRAPAANIRHIFQRDSSHPSHPPCGAVTSALLITRHCVIPMPGQTHRSSLTRASKSSTLEPPVPARNSMPTYQRLERPDRHTPQSASRQASTSAIWIGAILPLLTAMCSELESKTFAWWLLRVTGLHAHHQQRVCLGPFSTSFAAPMSVPLLLLPPSHKQTTSAAIDMTDELHGVLHLEVGGLNDLLSLEVFGPSVLFECQNVGAGRDRRGP